MASRNPPDFELPYTQYALNGQNGRMNFSTATGGPEGAGGTFQVPGFEYGKKAEPNFVADMLRGNMTPSEVAFAFFTTCNVALLQDAIRKEVYLRSGPKKYVIDDQDVDELKMIMRGIFYQYAKNLPNDIRGQIEELNSRVVQWSVPHILSAVDHYMYYLKDIDTLPVPMEQPVLMSRAGTRSKPLNPFM